MLLMLQLLFAISAISFTMFYSIAYAGEENCTETIMNDTIPSLIVKGLFSPKYDQSVMPRRTGVNVEIELVVQAIWAISEITSSFTSDVLFSQIWHDHRLSYFKQTNCIPNITVANQMLQKLWTPNICFINSKDTEIHKSPTENTFLLVYPNGTVWVNHRVREVHHASQVRVRQLRNGSPANDRSQRWIENDQHIAAAKVNFCVDRNSMDVNDPEYENNMDQLIRDYLDIVQQHIG